MRASDDSALPDQAFAGYAAGQRSERRLVDRRIRAARFPATKSLDAFDFMVIPTLNKMLVLELARSEYVIRNENVIALGPSGTGKTALGQPDSLV